MDLENRKSHFVEEYLKLTNVRIIEKLERVLREEKQKHLQKTQETLTEEDLWARIDASEEDIRSGNLHSQEQVEVYFARKAKK